MCPRRPELRQKCLPWRSRHSPQETARRWSTRRAPRRGDVSLGYETPKPPGLTADARQSRKARNGCVTPRPKLPSVRVDLLGTLAVTHDGGVEGRHLGGRRAQLALALLALTPGSVPAEQLAEALWGEQPPPTWRAALRGTIRGLRDALSPIGLGGEALIVTVPGGYALSEAADGRCGPCREVAAAGRDRSCPPVSSAEAAEAAEPEAGCSGAAAAGRRGPAVARGPPQADRRDGLRFAAHPRRGRRAV